MIILTHVLIALTSIAFSGYVFFAPSRNKVRMSYGLIAMTLASGTYLVVSMNSPILSACVTGLVYLAFALAGTLAAQRKLAAQKVIH